MLARMSAAEAVMRAEGVQPGAATHLARARSWRRYGTGPVSALHRACAADLVNGSLRLSGGIR
jgi:hypothetical protein